MEETDVEKHFLDFIDDLRRLNAVVARLPRRRRKAFVEGKRSWATERLRQLYDSPLILNRQTHMQHLEQIHGLFEQIGF